MRTGLVLGAGGVVGASWLVGALEALRCATGWNPSHADRIVGTSAGSVVGCLIADGVTPSGLSACIAGRTPDEVQDGDWLAERIDPAGFRFHRGIPHIIPGSLRMAMSTLLRPTRHSPATLLAGWLPRGVASTRPIGRLIEAALTADWPVHQAFWAVAADYATGRRVVFGRDGAPRARAADAVAASCAIPGFYQPVTIARRRYVDGAICSPSNLDLLFGEDLDLVICLNPMSSRLAPPSRSPGDRIRALIRTEANRRLAREVRRLRGTGTEVLLLEPTPRDLRAMGWNLMAHGRCVGVVETAVETTSLVLRRLHAGPQLLPGGSRGRGGRIRASAARRDLRAAA